MKTKKHGKGLSHEQVVYIYHIEAVTDCTRYCCLLKSKADALREVCKLEKLGYSAIKLLIVSKDDKAS